MQRKDPEWHSSLKSGFVSTARRTQSHVVPVYIDKQDDKWIISFGTPIEVNKKDKNTDIAIQYLDAMRALKAEVRPDATEASKLSS